MDDYDGPIEVALEGLPEGLHATKGIIAPGQTDTTLLLSANPDARLAQALPLRLAGHAKIGARDVIHYADPDDKTKLIALMPKPDILMMAETKEVVIEPGGKAEVAVRIQRQNGFGGRAGGASRDGAWSADMSLSLSRKAPLPAARYHVRRPPPE